MRRRPEPRRRHAPPCTGFTLVELLIVVTILAVLAAVVVPNFAASTADSRLGAARSTLAGLRDAVQRYQIDHGSFPGATNAQASATVCPGGAGTGGPNTAAAVVEQLTLYTTPGGNACAARSHALLRYGPYLRGPALPVEPLSGSRSLAVVNTGRLPLTADAGDPGGWKYDTASGRIIVNLGAYQDL